MNLALTASMPEGCPSPGGNSPAHQSMPGISTPRVCDVLYPRPITNVLRNGRVPRTAPAVSPRPLERKSPTQPRRPPRGPLRTSCRALIPVMVWTHWHPLLVVQPWLATASLLCSLPVVTWLAEPLPITAVPEEPEISTVWFDVINVLREAGTALFFAKASAHGVPE